MAENQSTVENAKEKLDRWLKDGITRCTYLSLIHI